MFILRLRRSGSFLAKFLAYGLLLNGGQAGDVMPVFNPFRIFKVIASWPGTDIVFYQAGLNGPSEVASSYPFYAGGESQTSGNVRSRLFIDRLRPHLRIIGIALQVILCVAQRDTLVPVPQRVDLRDIRSHLLCFARAVPPWLLEGTGVVGDHARSGGVPAFCHRTVLVMAGAFQV